MATQLDSRPILGISAGDPGGIGPEITVKALAREDIYTLCRPLVVADARVIGDALRITRLPLEIHTVTVPDSGHYDHGTLDVLDVPNMDPAELRYKEVTARQGKAAYEYVARVIELALQGRIHGTVTAPINKAALNAAGYAFAGHTEIYAALTGVKDYAMMLAHEDFRVVHVSTHVSLSEACELVKAERVLRVIELAGEAVKKLGVRSPRLAVAGLNPHCGEGGLFGLEDETEILPAVEAARRSGIDAEGPVAADTVFPKMRGGLYDAVVVMYHDQGHIPMKLLGFALDRDTGQWESVAGVNITLGLPIVRTSVDHGTAFGKAGEGRANPQSLIEAIRLAALLAKDRMEPAERG